MHHLDPASLTFAAVSAILHTWSKCLSLAGLYARAEFALKAAATPVLFSKGQLAACSLGSDVYNSLISKGVFGYSLPSTPKSRPFTASRPGTSSSRTGTAGGNVDSVRRPITAGTRSENVGAAVTIGSILAAKGSDHFDDVDGIIPAVVQEMMLQEDTEQLNDDITFHNDHSRVIHPQCTSWIDVALEAASSHRSFQHATRSHIFCQVFGRALQY
jgi:hypothetical protein